MLLKNPTQRRLVIEALNLIIEPGAEVEIEDGYCRPRQCVPGTKPQDSAIKMLAPQLIPADPALVAAWKTNTIDVGPVKLPPPTQAQLEASGLPPGVAALAAAGNADTAPKPGKPNGKPGSAPAAKPAAAGG